MILHTVPDPHDTRTQLLSVTTVIWAALEYGLLKARDYFEQEGTEIDPYLAANITRYHAKLYLEAHQDDGTYVRVELANCGLRVVAMRDGCEFDVWIRKSDDGELPVPQSENQRAFYHQPAMIGFFPEPTTAATIGVSLLMLWEAPKSYTHITSLILACPEAGGETKSDVAAHWSIPVPHPMTTQVVDEPHDAQDEPADDVPMDDDIDATADSNPNDDGDNE